MISRLKQLGFEGPFAGGKHQFLTRGARRLSCLTPHVGDIGPSLLSRVLQQAGVSREEWGPYRIRAAMPAAWFWVRVIVGRTPMALTPTIPMQAVEPQPRKKFTRAEVDMLQSTGIFEGRRYELIDGDLIEKMGQIPPHAFALQLVLDWLVRLLPGNRIRVQSPMEASGKDRELSVPEPDFAVLREVTRECRRRTPRGDELSLVIEVSDTRRGVRSFPQSDPLGPGGRSRILGSRPATAHAGRGIPIRTEPQYRRIQLCGEADFRAVWRTQRPRGRAASGQGLTRVRYSGEHAGYQRQRVPPARSYHH